MDKVYQIKVGKKRYQVVLYTGYSTAKEFERAIVSCTIMPRDCPMTFYTGIAVHKPNDDRDYQHAERIAFKRAVGALINQALADAAIEATSENGKASKTAELLRRIMSGFRKAMHDIRDTNTSPSK